MYSLVLHCVQIVVEHSQNRSEREKGTHMHSERECVCVYVCIYQLSKRADSCPKFSGFSRSSLNLSPVCWVHLTLEKLHPEMQLHWHGMYCANGKIQSWFVLLHLTGISRLPFTITGLVLIGLFLSCHFSSYGPYGPDFFPPENSPIFFMKTWALFFSFFLFCMSLVEQQGDDRWYVQLAAIWHC